MPTLYFTVDAALLRELGERLVGKPHIALAELVKNGYDADANKVIIEFDPDNDYIKIIDDGHGMDLEEFKNFWMRIGSTHKEKQRLSRGFQRSMTGSKGVGRLSVQYLAKKMELCTVSDKSPSKSLKASVEWENAVSAGDLTKSEVNYEIEESGDPQNYVKQGTQITLSGLKHDWKNNSTLLTDLLKEIWWLQPPFQNPHPLNSEDKKELFEIKFVSPNHELIEIFKFKIRAVMDIWYAKIIGKNERGNVNISVEYTGEEPKHYKHFFQNCKLNGGSFEIRIYYLKYHQPYGIRVDEARDYFDRYGGVHVYDGGFHLPYYGTKHNDWLNIQHDQAQRSRQTKLLPDDLKFDNGSLSFLPTLSRIFGVVNVNTAKEENLNILITRDRLQENDAYTDLRNIVRFAMDLYANEEARRVWNRGRLSKEIIPERERFKKIEDVFQKYKSEIPERVYNELQTGINEVNETIEIKSETIVKQTSLLGPLATAGISSLAYQHELNQQFRNIDGIVKIMENVPAKEEDILKLINHLKEDLNSWVKRARATNALFSYLADPDNINKKERFRAKRVIEEIKDQVNVLARGIPIETSRIDSEILLPKASLAEWSSIFQNVFINAFNAMLDLENKKLDVSFRLIDGYQEILIQDTGVGINLAEADILFKPFERKSTISSERRSLGYGGTGLGLTIVSLVAQNIGCKVSFVEPEQGFNTAFSIKWMEKNE